MFDEALLEPIKYYESELKEKFSRIANEYFDELVKRSGIDVDENRRTAASYREKKATADAASKRLSAVKGLRAALIVLAVIAFVSALALFAGGGSSGAIAAGVAVTVFAVATVIVVCTVFKKKIAQASERSKAFIEKAQAELRVAEGQIAALNALFSSEMTAELIEKAMPVVKIDRNFNMRRFDYMNGKYGFSDNLDTTESTIDLVSGEIAGNPYLIEKRLKVRVGTQTYYGSLVITYTERYTDADGKTRTRSVTQTLHASVVKPKPYYGTSTVLVYGNDAAPDLTFSRSPRHMEKLSDKQLERKVKKGAKELIKKEQKDATDNDPTTNFTKLGNDEFEVLFNAVDRSDEVQFRLLFTALAQKNMISLLLNSAGYGDDFSFNKRKCLNYVRCEHMQNADLDASPSRYVSYDADLARSNFVSYNESYFKKLFFLFAPVLSIPMYQQQAPKRYDYKRDYPRNNTSYEAERIANKMGAGNFAHPKTASGVILKTDLMTKKGGSDRIAVRAYSYSTEPRCDYVPVVGGDGRSHLVPVPWEEYIPIENVSEITMKDVGLRDREFAESAKAVGAIAKSPVWAFCHGIFARASNGDADLDKDFD